MKKATLKQLIVSILLVTAFTAIANAQNNIPVASMNQPGQLALKSYTIDDVQIAINELNSRINDLNTKLNNTAISDQEKPGLISELEEAESSLNAAKNKMEEINRVNNEKKIKETKPTSEASKRADRNAADKKVKDE